MSAEAGGAVREVLRKELAARGYPVANDTVALRQELYVQGPDDRAAAMFEVKSSAAEAAETMYQGRWTSDLPPRYAVLPVAEQGTPDAGFLLQAGLSVLFFREVGEDILFVDLERAFETIGRPIEDAGADRRQT